MQQEVSAYYDQTQLHYHRWWQLNKGMSLHYGLWEHGTKNFLEALRNTNKYMARQAGVQPGQQILDAGCGVGGAAIFLASEYQARVTGISLSSRQIETARENAKKNGVEDLIEFEVMDYCNTSFKDQSFDLIWACESSSSAPDKAKMLKEWQRILKPGGQVILLDFFATMQNNHPLIEEWCSLWAMSPLVTKLNFEASAVNNQFEIEHTESLNSKIIPTIKRMYRSYWLGIIPSRLYNFLFGAQKYSRNHYKSGFYQYQSFKNSLWTYHAYLLKKMT